MTSTSSLVNRTNIKVKSVNKKTKNLILHFASNEVLHLGKKKLAKLLYFVDFTNYELKSKSITGLGYEKWTYGPVPAKFYDILHELKKENVIDLKESSTLYMPTKITPKMKPDYTVFSKDEMDVIKSITEKFKSATAADIESAAKKEPPYKMVNEGQPIPYHLAVYRNSFDQMTLDENTSA